MVVLFPFCDITCVYDKDYVFSNGIFYGNADNLYISKNEIILHQLRS